MIKIKNSLNLLAILTLFFLALAQSTQARERRTLEVWTSSENIKRAIEALVNDFEKKYDTDVRVTVLNRELTTQFQTAGLSQKGPDILCWAHDVIGELASSGLIEPINISPELAEAFLPQALDAFRFDGKIYGYPYDIESIAFIYNPTLLASPPENIEELIDFSHRFRRENPNKFGFLYEIKNFFFSFPIIAAGGGEIFKRDDEERLIPNQLALAGPEIIKNVEVLNRFVQEGVIPFSTDRSIAFELFKQGRLAAMIDGPWAISELERSRVDYRVAPIPKVRGKDARPFLGTHGFMIRRSSSNKILAKELIENYLVTKKGIVTLYKNDPRAPSREDSLNEIRKMLPKNQAKHLDAFLKSSENALPMPNIPQMSAVWPMMEQALTFIMQSKRPPQKVLENAVNNFANE